MQVDVELRSTDQLLIIHRGDGTITVTLPQYAVEKAVSDAAAHGRMTMNPKLGKRFDYGSHEWAAFPGDGRCTKCKTSRENVEDALVPPTCPGAPIPAGTVLLEVRDMRYTADGNGNVVVKSVAMENANATREGYMHPMGTIQ